MCALARQGNDLGGRNVLATALAVALVMSGCPSTKPVVRVVPGHVDGTETPDDGVARLRFLDHWAACEVGVNGQREGIMRDRGGSAVVAPLAPGEAIAVATPEGPFQGGIRRVGEVDVTWSFEYLISGTPPSSGVPESPWPAIEAGCSPHVLRQRHLAAVVLVSVADGPESLSRKLFAASDRAFDGDIRLGGLTVRLRPGERTTVFLPRGTHALRARPATSNGSDGCSSMEPILFEPARPLVDSSRFDARLELDGAGAVVAYDRCGLLASLRL